MVETRASRRAAEEDSISSSQAQRARPRSQSAAEESSHPPRTPKPPKRTKHHAKDGTASARTPSSRRTRLNSAQFVPQTPSQAPRTRSSIRREAEESIASSEPQLRPQEQTHPDEENSHVIRPIPSARRSARMSRTRPDSANDPNTQHKLQVTTPMRLTRSAARRTRAAAEAAVAEAPSLNDHDLPHSGSVLEHATDRDHVSGECQSTIVPETGTEEHSSQHVDSSHEQSPNSVHHSPVPMIQLERSNDLDNSSVEGQDAAQTKKSKEAEVEVIVIDDNDEIPDGVKFGAQIKADGSEAGTLCEYGHETEENETRNDGFAPVLQHSTTDALPSAEEVYELDDDITKSLGLEVDGYDQKSNTVDVSPPHQVEHDFAQSDKKESEQGRMMNLTKSSYSNEKEQHQTSLPRKETNVVPSEGPHQKQSQESGVAKPLLLEDSESNQTENKVATAASQQKANDTTMSEEREQMRDKPSKSPHLSEERTNQTKKRVAVPASQLKSADVVSSGEEEDSGDFVKESLVSKDITSPGHDVANEVKEVTDVNRRDTSKIDTYSLALPSAEACKKPVDEIIHTVTGEPKPHQIQSVDQMLKLDDKMMSLFFRRDAIISGFCRQFLKQTYARQTKLEFGTDSRYQFIPKRRRGLPPMGPLAQVEIDDQFDAGQLWEELELRNKPLLAHLQRRVNAIHKEQEETTRALRRATANDESSEADEEFGENEGISERPEEEHAGDVLSHDKDSRKELEKGNSKSLINDGEDMKKQPKTVRFNVSSGKANSDDKTDERRLGDDQDLQRSSSRTRKRQGLEDGFFSVNDMENFAAEAEGLALSGKLIASDNEDDRNDGWSESVSSEEQEQGTDGKIGRFLYSDFFDPPTKIGGKHTGAVKALQLLEDDELSNFGANLETGKPRGSPALDSALPAGVSEPDNSQTTPLERSRSRAKRKIEAMEEASVSKKSWELRGEISAFARPKDSLLDTDMHHDIAVKPKAFLASEINETIEDVIKQRIIDGLFDDVVMQLPDAYVEHKRKGRQNELADISQEKPTEGLADLYAREFNEEREKQNKVMLASKEVQREADQPLTEQQQEVNKLFEKISKKLDALSSMRFTPLSEDVKIDVSTKNVKAIAAEEAIPEGVSDANLLTPKEVFSVDKKEAVGEKEVTKEERRAARRMRKSKKRKRQAADESKKQALVQTDPILAEKRRAETALIRRGKKPKLADEDTRLGVTQTKDLMKRFGGIKNPEAIETQLHKKPASHFRL
ncbi:U3 small nucleolar RNA-associated protein MPP10 [Gracilariopsis chorda]|uniref:U3 small nucleolar RNA-associated protein MPP10 n=1 Tax=Gracilariopsis chorda TaxID=448386 RepID=A0A2V3IWW5_9FLOR|nr:U3 small nucleolar RNA-associated protein MPP10 [Gracilariopsis chorda]|eukprot:PXF46553.1 U3 small nucleolar RNA-associated protein MPP10 [Gracilariopsis chorda]